MGLAVGDRGRANLTISQRETADISIISGINPLSKDLTSPNLTFVLPLTSYPDWNRRELVRVDPARRPQPHSSRVSC